MKKPLIALSAFVITVSVLWVITTADHSTSAPLNADASKTNLEANILNGAITPLETNTPNASPSSNPTSTSGKASPSEKPSPTPSLLTPEKLVTPSPAPSSSKTPTPTPSPTRTSTSTPTSTLSLSPSASATPTPSPSIAPSSTPTSTTQVQGIVVTSLTSPVAQKQTASIAIRTEAIADCTIIVTLPSGSKSTSKDLGPKTANANGDVTWTWSINWNTKPGTATIDLTCISGPNTYTGQTTMEIIASS